MFVWNVYVMFQRRAQVCIIKLTGSAWPSFGPQQSTHQCEGVGDSFTYQTYACPHEKRSWLKSSCYPRIDIRYQSGFLFSVSILWPVTCAGVNSSVKRVSALSGCTNVEINMQDGHCHNCLRPVPMWQLCEFITVWHWFYKLAGNK